MVSSKNLFVAVALAGVVAANSCSPSSTFNVLNQGDASTVGQCKTFTGDININSTSGTTLDFGSVQSITGTVTVDGDSQLSSLTFGSLTQLGGLTLSNLTSLSTLTLSSIEKVGDISMINLAALATFDFGNSLQSAGSVVIENVQISSISGISAAQTINNVTISNCQHLTQVMFNVTEIGTVNIGPNNVAQGLSISFPNLETASALTLRNATSISTPSLTNVSDTLSLIGNKLTSYGATNLTWAGALVIQSNPSLNNLSFPQLVTLNGSDATLDIENNTALQEIAGFPLLSTVSGDVVFAGNLNNVSLPDLTKVAGAMTVLSTSTKFNCDNITNYGRSGTGVVYGSVRCSSDDQSAIGSTNGSSTSGGSGSSGSSAAIALELPTFLTTGAFAAVLAFLA